MAQQAIVASGMSFFDEMIWPPISTLAGALSLPEGVSLRLLSGDELGKLPELLRAWYPAVQVGSESVFLSLEFLQQRLVHESHLDADIFAFFVIQEGVPVGFMSFERQPASATLHGRLGALAPEARAGFLGAMGFLAFEKLGALCGAELLLSWITLASRHQQLFAERRGFQLVGIVPGFDRDFFTVKHAPRVFEALVAKLLVPKSELLVPSLESLTPRTRRLFEAIFGPGRPSV